MDELEPSVFRQLEEEGVPPELCVNPPNFAICGICFKIMREPTSVCSQEHFYCMSCLLSNREINNDDSCPHCREELTHKIKHGEVVECFHHSRFVSNLIDDLEVRCYTTLENDFNTSVGKKRRSCTIRSCKWTGPMSSLHEHLRNCQYVDKKNEKIYFLSENLKKMKKSHMTEMNDKDETLDSFRRYNADMSMEITSLRDTIKKDKNEGKEKDKCIKSLRNSNHELKMLLKENVYDWNNRIPTGNLKFHWRKFDVPHDFDGTMHVEIENKNYSIISHDANPGGKVAVKIPFETHNNDIDECVKINSMKEYYYKLIHRFFVVGFALIFLLSLFDVESYQRKAILERGNM